MTNDCASPRRTAVRLTLLGLTLALLRGEVCGAENRFPDGAPRAQEAAARERRDVHRGLGAAPSGEKATLASGGAPSEGDDRVERQLRGRRGYARSESQAYLSLLEWYVVQRADEFAAFLQHERPSGFPHFASIAHLWRIYIRVLGLTWRTSPWRRQLSIAVVGASCTIECLVEGIYENVVGRLTELTLPRAPWRPSTVEDRYLQEIARDYATFLHVRRWYEYPFAARLSGLWALHGPLDGSLVRRLDRRLALTVGLALKAGWGWLIRTCSESAFAPEDQVVQVWVRRMPAARDPAIVSREELDPRSELLFLPRHDAFTAVVTSLAHQGVRFVRVAGNEEILMTVIAATGWVDTRYRGLFLLEWPILTEPGKKRVAMIVGVERLDAAIRSLAAEGVRIDRLYDF
jgi:hypothetical protein